MSEVLEKIINIENKDQIEKKRITEHELSVKKVSKKQIVRPFLFSIEKDNKVSYLFGTIHGISYDEIPKECLELFKLCSNCVVEDTGVYSEEVQQQIDYFYSKTILRDKNSQSWCSQLPPEIKEFLQKCLTEFYSSMPEEWIHPIELLEPWAALEMADQGHTSLCVKSDNEDMDAEIMDFGISNNFSPENRHSLEHQLEVIGTWKEHGNSIEDVIKWNNKSAPLLLKKDDENSRKTREEDARKCDQYRRGELMYNQGLLDELNQDNELRIRNLKWIPKMIQYHAILEGPILFVVGAGHLLGKNGLLSLLPNEGFKLKYYAVNRTFIEFAYSERAQSLSKEEDAKVSDEQNKLSSQQPTLLFFSQVELPALALRVDDEETPIEKRKRIAMDHGR